MIQIDCSLFKVSLVQICHQWQQSLISIVSNRFENDLESIQLLIKENTEKINVVPKTYDDIPIYQEFIEQLKNDIPRIEDKLPVINEQIGLLHRYEIDINPKV